MNPKLANILSKYYTVGKVNIKEIFNDIDTNTISKLPLDET